MTPIVDDWSAARDSQLKRSPLAMSGKLLVYAKEDELDFLDPTTLARVDYVSVGYWSICVLTGGTLVAFAKPDKGPCEIDVFEGTHIDRSLAVPDCVVIDNKRVIAGAASELYLPFGLDLLARYRISNGSLIEVDSVTLDERARHDLDQAVGLGDGRVLVSARGKLQIYEPGKPTQTYPITGSVAHIALGAGGRIWYSVWTKGRIDRVVLTPPNAPGAIEATISAAPARITHMAADDRGWLAMITNTTGETRFIWHVVVLDQTGAERLRVELDDDIVKQVGVNLNLAFVALTPTRVVVAARGDGVFAWDTATGARIPR